MGWVERMADKAYCEARFCNSATMEVPDVAGPVVGLLDRFDLGHAWIPREPGCQRDRGRNRLTTRHLRRSA